MCANGIYKLHITNTVLGPIPIKISCKTLVDFMVFKTRPNIQL